MLSKTLFLYFIVASYGFVLTGCTLSIPGQALYFPIDENNKMGLIDKDIERWIPESDRKRIKSFIAAAEPTAVLQWSTRLTYYRLNSHSIFLDESGRPCRCYTLERQPLLGKVYKTREIAYRDIDAQWKRKHSIPLPLNSFSIKTIAHEN